MSGYRRPIFKAAAVQAAPVLRDEPEYMDLQATLEKACDLIIQAGATEKRPESREHLEEKIAALEKQIKSMREEMNK